jgi:hypothetical protein
MDEWGGLADELGLLALLSVLIKPILQNDSKALLQL